ncbi:hypothetical protein OAG60_02800 [bacterium]|nr:hypothetical protein [bacterium]
MQVNRNSNLEIPESLKDKLLAFRKRVWILKMVEATAGAAVGVLIGLGNFAVMQSRSGIAGVFVSYQSDFSGCNSCTGSLLAKLNSLQLNELHMFHSGFSECSAP